MKAAVTEYIESLGDNYDQIICGRPANQVLKLAEIPPLGIPLAPKKSKDPDSPPCKIFLCRLPLPAASDALFVYKGQGLLTWPHFIANEAAAMQVAAEWRKAGNYEHARVPELYCCNVAFKEGEEITKPLYICMEYINGITLDSGPYVRGCLGWTHREKRGFVRQMALFRLSLLLTRRNVIGGFAPDTGYMANNLIYSRHVCHWNVKPRYHIPPPIGFYKNLRRTDDTKKWVCQILDRELQYFSTDTMTTNQFKHQYLDSDSRRKTSKKLALSEGIKKGPSRRLIQMDALREISGKIQNRRFRTKKDEVPQGSFCLTHGDLEEGFNILMGGRKMLAVIDWETAMSVPYSIAIRDINQVQDAIPDPMEWRNHFQDTGKIPPFDVEPLDLFSGETWDDYLNSMTAQRRIMEARRVKIRAARAPAPESTMIEGNFAAYGRLTPEDLFHGDRFSDEAEEYEARDGPEYKHYPIVQVEGGPSLIPGCEPHTWYYAPVLHLVDQYMRDYQATSEICKWEDPWVSYICYKGVDPVHVT